MSKKIPRLLLFDIDGTLVVSRHKQVGKDFGSYLLECLSVVFGQDIKRNGVEFAGGTDPGITKAILTTYNINEKTYPNYENNVKTVFEMLPQVAEKGVEEGRYNWKILPNVNELLELLHKRNDVKLGLLTGNIKPVAFLKLQTAGVDTSYFEVDCPGKVLGAFGSDHGNRHKLVEIAKQRYCDFLQVDKVDASDILVVGDTPKDIECAHVNQSPCVAVATGRYNEEQLSDADCVLSSFEDVNKSVLAMVETMRA